MSDLVEWLKSREPKYIKRYDPEYAREREELRRQIHEYEMKKVAGNQEIIDDEWEELIQSIQRAKSGGRYEFLYQRFSIQDENT